MPIFGDNEMAFYLDREDLFEFVEDVLTTYLKHSRIFILFLILSLSTEFISSYFNYTDRENEI
jgi:hypothetical protein